MVTTNYDDLLENLLKLSTDNVFIGQSQLFNPKSVEVGELFKIHGCVTQSDDIVITEEDYEKFKKNAKLFTAKLLTLICENPVVFLGYSMSDPNVHQILTDLVECLTVKQISELRNHFYLINYKEGEQSLIEEVFQFKAKSYDGKELHFPITMISTDNYLEVYKQLSHLTPAMNIHTIKQVKRLLKDIVTESAEVTSDKETIMTILVDDIEKLSDEKRKFAVAIGGVKDISNYDHKTRPFTDIIEDILYENHNLNSERLISQTYEQSYLRNSMIVPIYKYKKDLSEELLDKCKLTKKYLDKHKNLEDYLSNSIKKDIKRPIIPVSSNWNDIELMKATSSRKVYMWLFKNAYRLPLEKFREFLCQEFLQYKNLEAKSDFHRLVAIYDFLKNKNSHVEGSYLNNMNSK